jgi:NAD(P)-dependent dehydrogenase (short-subunit alcohol dehydrogenase family)
MAVVAVLVFVAAYILIANRAVPKMVTTLVGAGIILGLGVASAEEVFYSHETGVDWDVIFRVGRSIWRRSKPHTRWEGLREPSEVSKAILFLASDQASFITGAILPR